MVKRLKSKKLELGVCYYPEQWDEQLWEDDFRRMKELGFTYVRIGEFAWSIFEPTEGNYSFELFDRVISMAGQMGLKVILGTPTATPPAWLTHKYPEVLNETREGVQFQHGMRRHYTHNSPIYQELSAKIVTQLAEHYKDNPTVIGWQIDNEFNCEVSEFYSKADHDAFRMWVSEKYKTLDNLNENWGTAFWNQQYTDWEQVFLTRPTPSNSPNPHQALDEKRFISDSVISYVKLQVDIIRSITTNQWITTNGLFGHLDNHRMTEELLDFFAYDSYPNFSTIFPDQGEKPLLDRKWSWNLSVVRGISTNFAIFEQQAGPGGWVNRMEQPAPKPGQMRLWTYQSIAHGADMVLYFRWRTATKGTEIYWHGLNDYHNQPNRRIKEADAISKEIQQFGEKIAGSTFKADVAILTDYHNEWDGEFDSWHGPYSGKSRMAWFKALQYKHIPVDVCHVNAESTLEQLQNYKVLIYPHPAILSEQTAQLLEEYVEAGGKIVFGCRSGYKAENGQPYMLPFPGTLSNLVGITVEDFTRIGEYEETPSVLWHNSQETSAEDFNEVLTVEDSSVEVLGHYQNAYYEGKPAIVKHTFGRGTSYYLGGVFNISIANRLIDELELPSPINDLVELPESIEVSIREKDSTQYLFLLNYSAQSQTIVVKQAGLEDLISGKGLEQSVSIEPYGVMVVPVTALN